MDLRARSTNWLPPACSQTRDHTCPDGGLNRNLGVCPDVELDLQPFRHGTDAPNRATLARDKMTFFLILTRGHAY